MLRHEFVEIGGIGHGWRAADAGDDECGIGRAALHSIGDRFSIDQAHDKAAHESIARASGFQRLYRVDANFESLIASKCQGSLASHFIDNEFAFFHGIVFGQSAAITLLCKHGEFLVIANDNVAKSNCFRADARGLGAAFPGIWPIVHVDDRCHSGKLGCLQRLQRDAARRFQCQPRAGDDETIKVFPLYCLGLFLIQFEIGGAVAIENVLAVDVAGFDYRQRIAMLAADGADMARVDTIGLQLAHNKPANRIIGNGREQADAAHVASGCHCDICRRAAKCGFEVFCLFEACARWIGIEVHAGAAKDQNSVAGYQSVVSYLFCSCWRTIWCVSVLCNMTVDKIKNTAPIRIGIIGSGYMGKAHAVAMSAVGAVFNTRLRPWLEMICTTTAEGAAQKALEFGFARSTAHWRNLVEDPHIDAVVIASPQAFHRDIALAAFALKKPVLCEKPLGAGLADSRAMVAAAEASGAVNMVGFNYIRTPASQLAREIVASGEIGQLTFFQGEHTEDFLADPNLPATWRTKGRANGNMGDLAPHPINCALALMGPITSLIAEIETAHKTRGGEVVTNDDHAQLMVRFENGCLGSIYSSRIATGRKMGYAYNIYGTKGAIRFDQEDQNALWLYKGEQRPERQGFTKILAGPAHPDYQPFCLGPGHGTGYQDQIIIEAKDFLEAIADGKSRWPTFRDGMMVNEVIEAAWLSHEHKRWVKVDEV